MPEEMTVYEALKFYSDIEGGDPDKVIELLDLDQLKDRKGTPTSRKDRRSERR